MCPKQTRVVSAVLAAVFAVAAPIHANGQISQDKQSKHRMSVEMLERMIADASSGSTVVIPPGTYRGQLKVRSPVVLDGQGEVTIDGEGIGTVIEITAPSVTVRNIRVTGSGDNVTGEPAAIRVLAPAVVIEHNVITDALFGIDLRESSDSVVRYNDITGKPLEPGRRGDGIRLWWSHHCTVEDNIVRQARDMVFWYSEGLKISRNVVSGSRYGLHFMYSHDTTLEENELASNSVGVYLMYSNRITLIANRMTDNRGASGYGIGLKDCDDIELFGNALLANRVGIYIDNAPSSIDSIGSISSNMIAFNEIGLLATPNTHSNTIVSNAFIENEEQAATHGRGDLGNNTFSTAGTGNFWSDYAGFDHDRDGIGDLAYAPRNLFAAIVSREPNLRFFMHSPAQQAVDFTARALPELRPQPVFIDEHPLVKAPSIDITMPKHQSTPWHLAIVGICLIGGVACLGSWLYWEQPLGQTATKDVP
ncbi:MAG: nitrous oxide reductase family maturation protein NosD [Phycisphaeraceae bacterium]|nr:nitrous oxide reductase family maturation protein NosD [Phycisphaerales bacterium]MCB9858840.1 nitrous oxide reductase family maturation protein NosD [Phycisphaeraceae bacterium]